MNAARRSACPRTCTQYPHRISIYFEKSTAFLLPTPRIIRHLPAASRLGLRCTWPPCSHERVRNAGAPHHLRHPLPPLPTTSRNIAGTLSHFHSNLQTLIRKYTPDKRLQLSDLEAARVIVLSHYHLGASVCTTSVFSYTLVHFSFFLQNFPIAHQSSHIMCHRHEPAAFGKQ